MHFHVMCFNCVFISIIYMSIVWFFFIGAAGSTWTHPGGGAMKSRRIILIAKDSPSIFLFRFPFSSSSLFTCFVLFRTLYDMGRS